jgi:hypothetical protein
MTPERCTAFAFEVPPLFVAVALTVYVAPPVRPVTSQEPDRPVTVHVPAAAPAVVVVALTVYDFGTPPAVPAATATETWPMPAVTFGLAGTPGFTTATHTAYNVRSEVNVITLPSE